MAVIREDALQNALISVLIASENQGVDLEQLITRALAMTADYPREVLEATLRTDYAALVRQA